MLALSLVICLCFSCYVYYSISDLLTTLSIGTIDALVLIAGQKLQHAILRVRNLHNLVANMLRSPDTCMYYTFPQRYILPFS